MDFKYLQYIIVIAEEQNLTRAAERLFVSQSTLSLFLSKLEKDLGIPLFTRRKNRLVITPKGELYVNTAKDILEMKRELYEKLNIKQKIPTLNLGISSQLMLEIFAQIFAKFKPLVPQFNVNVTEGRSTVLLSKLQENKLDIAIVGRESVIQDDSYQIQLLKKEELWLIIPPSHPHASVASTDYTNPPVADMRLFSNENFALSPHDTCDYQIAQRLFKDYQMNANIICELNSTAPICQMVLKGLCLSVVPSYCIPRTLGLLVCRPPTPYYRYMLCLQHKDRRQAKEELVLMNMLIDTYVTYYDTV